MPLINNQTIAYLFCLVIVVIIPIWFMDFVPLSLKWKLLYTVAGAVGLYVALAYGSIKGFSGRRR